MHLVKRRGGAVPLLAELLGPLFRFGVGVLRAGKVRLEGEELGLQVLEHSGVGLGRPRRGGEAAGELADDRAAFHIDRRAEPAERPQSLPDARPPRDPASRRRRAVASRRMARRSLSRTLARRWRSPWPVSGRSRLAW